MKVDVLPSARMSDATSNLNAFIRRARDLTVFGNVDFDASVWTVVLSKHKRASSSHAGSNKLYFTHAKAGSRSESGRVPLRRPFAEFLKAAVRLREESAPRVLDDHAATIRAGRFLERTMENIHFDPSRLTRQHFEEAARLSRKTDSASGADRIDAKLVELASWLRRYGITPVPINFEGRTRCKKEIHERIGELAERRRSQKLPTDEELNALANLANRIHNPWDLLRIRTIELLVCGGWRINELLSIPVDCEVEEEAVRNGETLLDKDGSRIVRFGIRYFGEKGAPPLPKWIPSPLVDVAKRAVADIRRITQPCRDALAFAEQSGGYLPISGLDAGELSEEISARKVTEILGLSRQGGTVWLKSRGIAHYRGARVFGIRGEIIAALKTYSPQLPDDSPIKLHQYMFLIPLNFMHEGRATIPGTVTFVTDQMIHTFIGGKRNLKSVFDKHGITRADGERIRMNTHQFRHWLNTLAQNGGMGQLELARWSGRREERQNAAYDHVSGAQLAERVRILIEAGEIRGPLRHMCQRLPPVERKSFFASQIATAHVTDIGLCVHDWSLTPCPSFGACASCEEHIVVKGDLDQRSAAENLLDDTRRLIAASLTEVGDHTYGADRWLASQQRMAASLESIVRIHDDTSIPDGTLVQANSLA